MFRSLRDGWVLLAIIFSLIVIIPIFVIVSFVFTPQNDTWSHLTSTVLNSYIINSIKIAIYVFFTTVIIGTVTAWIVSVYNFPFRKYFEWLLILPLAIPSYALCYVYAEILGFNGYINTLLINVVSINTNLLNFYSIKGAIFVFTFSLYPYVYILARQAFKDQSASYLEIAQISGYSLFSIFYKTSIPLARPAIIGGATLVIMETLADYGVADYLGIDTFTKGIYRTWFNLGDISSAGKLSFLLLLTVFIIIFIEKFFRRGAKYNKNIRRDKPFIRKNLNSFYSFLMFFICLFPIIIGFIIPFIALLSWSHIGFNYWDLNTFIKIILSSFSLAFFAAFICIIFAIIIVYGLRINYKTVSPFARLASMGYSIPGAVAAIGILIPVIWLDNLIDYVSVKFFGYSTGLLISGTWAALLFAYVVRFLALSIQSVENSFLRISNSLDYAAKVLGSSGKDIIKNIHLKLNIGGICFGILIVFVDVLKELPATMILRPYDLSTLAIRAHELAMDERLYDASLPLVTIIIVCLLPLFIVNKVILSDKRIN